jgi:16S rRNA (cytidine1402-2'-O)-methyltransferase
VNEKRTSGSLYVVATPIGNLEDITLRAKRVLENVSLIACEDTRHTVKLLNHLGISTPLTSYYREKEQLKTVRLMKKLQDGLDIALVTDAGTPALSDPGAVLIREAREAGISVIPVPGPSALTAAVSVAGLETIGFFFGGFPPVKKGMREKFFQRLATLPYPLVFYESPRRIVSCLKLCLAVFGNRRAMLFKELTKLHENCFRGKLSEILAQVGESIRGELVLIILPHEEPNKRTPDNLRELLSWYKKQPGMSLKDAVRRISQDLNLPRGEVYREALAVWKTGD